MWSRAKQLLLLGVILVLIEGPFLYFVFTHAQNSYGYTELNIKVGYVTSHTFDNSTFSCCYLPNGLGYGPFPSTPFDYPFQPRSYPPGFLNLIYSKTPELCLSFKEYSSLMILNITKSEIWLGLRINVTEVQPDHIVIWVKPTS